MLGMPNLAAPLSQRIQQFLDACQREMYEHHGGVIVERYAITPHHEASPSIDCLDGISEFLALAQDFRDRLYPDILGLFDDYAPLLDARTHTIDNYNTARRWSDTQRRNRIQAIRSFPWLFHELGLRTGGPGYYHEPAEITVNKQASIVAAIDLGQPLLPLLATCYNVGKHTLRYARGFLKSRYCLPSTIPVILWLLDDIKPDKRPTSNTDMEALDKVIPWISGWRQESDRVYVDEVAITLFKDGVNGCRSLLRKWCPSHNPEDPFEDVSDYLAEHTGKTNEGLMTQELFGSLAKEWIRESGLLTLLAESERWHTSWWERDLEIEIASWAPLMLEPQQFGNLVAHELSNTQMLIEEGNAMRHCIASYALLCRAGEARIYSLREATSGERRSTLHIGPDESGRLTIYEHRARANRDPDAECVAAAWCLLDLLSEIVTTNPDDPLACAT